MIKKYLCKNDDLKYYFCLDNFTFCLFGFCVFFLGAFWVSKFWGYLLWSFFDFALCVIFGYLTDKQFKKVYKLKKSKRSIKK